jgi:hypothetical protein
MTREFVFRTSLPRGVFRDFNLWRERVAEFGPIPRGVTVYRKRVPGGFRWVVLPDPEKRLRIEAMFREVDEFLKGRLGT